MATVNNVRVALMNVTTPKFRDTIVPLNVLTLGSYLTERNIIPQKNILIVSGFDRSHLDTIAAFKPDIMGMSSVTNAYPEAIRQAEEIRKRIRTHIILGGHHISGHPASMKAPFDAGVVGEGEIPLTDMISVLGNGGTLDEHAFSGMQSVLYRDRKGNLKVNAMRPLMTAEEIPKLNWELLPQSEFIRNKTILRDKSPVSLRWATMFTARGCPYKCSFCARQVLWPGHSGFRFFPVERVGEEISHLYHHYGVRCIYILDDTFVVSKPRLRALIEELRRRDLLGKISFFRLYVRANLVDPEMVSLLKEFGAVSVSMGIESGSENMLKYLKSGPLKVADVKRAVQLFADAHIHISASFMIFSPNETAQDLDDTYALASWIAENDYTYELEVYRTSPMPGTKLWADAITMGVIDPDNVPWQDFLVKTGLKKIWFTNGMSRETIRRYYRKFMELPEIPKRRIHSLPGWQATQRETKRINAPIDASLIMHYKLKKFLQHPLTGIGNLVRKPEILGFAASDIRQSIGR